MRTNHCARLNQSPYHVDALKISRCRWMMMLKELTAATVVRKGVARSHEHPPCFCHCQAIQIRYRLHATLMLYQCVWAPFRNLTFSSRSGSESIYLLKSSTVISCSQISRTASCSSSKVHPPYGFLFRSLYFKILHTFSIGFKSGE